MRKIHPIILAFCLLALVDTLLLYGAFTTRNFNEILGDTQPATCAVGDAAFDTDNNVTLRCIGGNVFAAVAMPSAYGQLYEDGSTVINIATGGTFVQWVSSTAGQSNLTTLSTANDNITVDTGGGGMYLVAFQVSYQGNANENYHWAVFVEGAKLDEAASVRKTSANDQGSQSGVGLAALSDTDEVDLRVTSTTNTKTATVNHVQLTIMRIGI